MTAKREQIFIEIERRLGLVSGAVEVQRMSSGDPSRFPALFIEDGGQSTDVESEPGVTRYGLTVTVEGYVKGGDGPEAHAEMNELYVAVVAEILAEPPLLGFAEQIDEGPMRVEVATLSSARRIGFSLDFDIVFVADRASPTA